jgi:putative ABC transport system permease protein
MTSYHARSPANIHSSHRDGISRIIAFCVAGMLLASLAGAAPEILINQRLAERLDLKPGDPIELSLSGDMKEAQRFVVRDTYEEKADPSQVPLRRSMVKMHLPDMEALTGRTDQLDLVSIQLRNPANASSLAARLNGEAIGFTAYSAPELAVRTSRTFEVVDRFQRAIALIAMAAGAVFIFALVVMRVEDQRKNFAILTITGISKKSIFQTLILEAVVFAFLASLLGAALGYAAAAGVNFYYREYYQTTLIFAKVTPQILIQAVCLSFLLGVIAGTFSWMRLKQLAVLEELGR